MLILIAVMVVISAIHRESAADELEFGFSKVDITPSKPLRLSGYGSRSTVSEGIETKLWTRAMVLRPADGEIHALIAVDTIGFPGVLTTSIQQRLERQYGITRKRFVQCGTHSHTAPHISDGLVNIFAVPFTAEQEADTREYTEWVADRVVESVGLAIDDLSPGELSFASGEVGFAVNRRVLEQGRWSGFGETPAGPVDHSLPVLKITGRDGKVRGTVFNYACHCTTLGGNFNRVCGDWAGYAAEFIEESNSGAVALCTIGAGADSNPGPRGELQFSEAHGQAIADEVQRILSGPMQAIEEGPITSFGYAGLVVDRPSIEELQEQLKSTRPQNRRHAENMLAINERKGRLPETYPMPIQTWSFGESLTMVFLGGEVVVDYALRLKQELENPNLWVTAYANDVFAYVASERVRREGGYEVEGSMIYYNQPGPWAEGTEEVVIQRVHEVLNNPQGEGALSPEDALSSFRLAPGFEIELVASEPLVADPVSFAFGPDGRLWVVEMGDYPRGIDANGRPGGRVKFLEDENDDGVFDRATLFLDGLSYPTGVMPWRDGVLISAAPTVIFAKDSNGDGKADQQRPLFEGFVESNPQHRINGFAYGLDNWIYLGSGDNSQEIRSVQTGRVVDMSGRDIRIKPDEGVLETVSGRTQYGRVCDNWGNWFGSSNSRPIFHFVISDRYLGRNRDVPAPSPTVHLLTPPVAPPVFPSSRTVDRFNDLFAANRFTSACSPLIFRDTSLGADVDSAAFICEPVHNLVHRSLVIPSGVTFRGERHPDEAQSEFLSSSDVWSRPVKLGTGPDGALWVADMYRQVIEHPQWIPDDWQKRLNVRSGDNLGRIYRVYRKGNRPERLPKLSDMSTAELVAQLRSSNGTIRDLAQQILVHRQDNSSVSDLKALATSAEAPTARIHALGTLSGLDQLSSAVLRTAVDDEDWRVQRFAFLLSEPRLNSDSALAARVTEMIHHPQLQVRFQAALSLGAWNDPQAGTVLGQFAAQDLEDRWMRTAVLSSATGHANSILQVLIDNPKATSGWLEMVQRCIETAIGQGGAKARNRILAIITARQGGEVQPWQFSALASFINASERSGADWDNLQRSGDESVQSLIESAERIFDVARKTVDNDDLPLEERAAALRVLGRGRDQRAKDVNVLVSQLAAQVPPTLQSTAIETLARVASGELAAILLADWSQHAPNLQREILETLLSRQSWTEALLDGIETKTVLPVDLDAAARSQLVTYRNRRIRDRARRLLSEMRSPSRDAIVAEYQPVSNIHGNLLRGAVIFNKRCATCHQFRARGNNLGPKLDALKDRSTKSLLISILDPNRAVEAKFRSYVAVTADGKAHTGMIVDESSSSLTLAGLTGETSVLLRTDLEDLKSTGQSFMPEGLEKDISIEQLADVIAFVQSGTRSTAGQDDSDFELSRRDLFELGINGLGSVKGSSRVRNAQTWLGKVPMAYCGGVSPLKLTWHSMPIPNDVNRSEPFTFRLPVAIAGNRLSSQGYELSMDGKPLVEFGTPFEDSSWEALDGRVKIRYLAVESSDDSTNGLLEIELPGPLVQPGTIREFSVRVPRSPNLWFGLLMPDKLN